MKFTFPIVNTRNNLLGAQVYIVQRLFELAVSDCDKALECNPNWIKAYFRKAVALSEQHNVIGADELAIQTLNVALQAAQQSQQENAEIIAEL